VLLQELLTSQTFASLVASTQKDNIFIWDGVDSWKLSGKGRVFKFPQWIHLAELQSLASSGMCDIASAVPSEGGNCNLYGKYVAA
jgi:hypothetical protein